MYTCSMCGNPIEGGTQYVSAFGKMVCLDCAVRNTLDDIMASFEVSYSEAPEEIVVAATVDGQAVDATTEETEKFFTSENPAFVPTQVGEKNVVLTTLSATTEIGDIACNRAYKKAWVYDSADDAEYWFEHYLKNMPNLISIDGIVTIDEIPEGYDVFQVDGDGAGE